MLYRCAHVWAAGRCHTTIQLHYPDNSICDFCYAFSLFVDVLFSLCFDFDSDSDSDFCFSLAFDLPFDFSCSFFCYLTFDVAFVFDFSSSIILSVIHLPGR